LATLVFGLGYLGAALAAALLREGHDVVGVDNGFATEWALLERLATGEAGPGGAGAPGSAGGPAPARGRLRLLWGDLRAAADVGAAFAAAGPVEAVYLLAAQASAHPAAAQPEYTEETNLRGPRHVLDAALQHGRPPVVYGSSFHVYGPALAGEVDEGHPYGPLRDLAHLSKVYAEKLGEMYATTRGLPFVPLRLGIVYGVGPVTRRDLRFVTVPHAFCLRALAGQPLAIHPSGLAPLAFLHLDDAVQALRLAAAGPPRGYAPANATGELATVLEVARLVQQTAWDAGVDAVLQLHTPPSAARHRAQPDRPPSAPAGGAPFAVRSRLAGAGWRPTGRLATAVPEIFAHYAGRRSWPSPR
jgi:nucleoside-diphosphate-sugar epimerase